jgi:8-oxo-dGTP pyrophosphatase MutT (NUDIX family)
MTETNPWKKLNSRVVYKNNWITVREDQVICPDEQPGIYGVVTGAIATGVVAINEKNELCLVGQYRYTIDKYSWEIAEGGAHGNETPLEAAKRELQEETGYTAKRWDTLGLPVHTSNCISDETGYIYLARELSFVGTKPDTTEILKTKFVPFKEALDMVHAGQISDAISIIGIMRAEKFL